MLILRADVLILGADVLKKLGYGRLPPDRTPLGAIQSVEHLKEILDQALTVNYVDELVLERQPSG